jgi:hypothetical protein
MFAQRNFGSNAVRLIVASVGAWLAAACADGAPTSPSSDIPLSARQLSNAPAPATFTFTAIDVPGALATSPQGINAAGAISGSYVDASGHVRSFILRDGGFTTVDYPDADNTSVHGIGPSGDVVGNWWNDGEEATAAHGFRRSVSGQFSTVHFPGHLYEIPQRILADGTILGCRHDHDFMGSMRGIRLAREGASEIDQVFASMHNGATPDGQLIVGLYTNMQAGRQEGYIINRGVFTPFVIPGSNLTSAWDVNAQGEIVGIYRDASGFHGYVMTAAGVTSLNYPGAVATRAFGINASGDVVGTYQAVAGGPARGFLAVRER